MLGNHDRRMPRRRVGNGSGVVLNRGNSVADLKASRRKRSVWEKWGDLAEQIASIVILSEVGRQPSRRSHADSACDAPPHGG